MGNVDLENWPELNKAKQEREAEKARQAEEENRELALVAAIDKERREAWNRIVRKWDSVVVPLLHMLGVVEWGEGGFKEYGPCDTWVGRPDFYWCVHGPGDYSFDCFSVRLDMVGRKDDPSLWRFRTSCYGDVEFWCPATKEDLKKVLVEVCKRGPGEVEIGQWSTADDLP